MFLDSQWKWEIVHAARRLRNAPGFAVVAIVTLAIGVGVNSAMFGLIDALLFRPPAHVSEPDRVVRVAFTGDPSAGSVEPSRGFRAGYPVFEELAATGSFEDIAGYTTATVSIGRGPDAYEANAMIVTPAFFRVLGVRPHAGSLVGTAARNTLGENHVVLAHGFWQRQFGSDPRIIGAPMLIGTSTYIVAGITPKGFSALQTRPIDLWIPIGDASSGYLFRTWRTSRGSRWFEVIGRLPASTPARAVEARASALLRNVQASGSEIGGVVTSPLVASRGADKSREVRISLWLAGVTAFVLLIACANVANLILARNIARAREYAVRLSLGATSGQLRRQLIADVLALAIPGMIAALFIEYAVRVAIPAFLPTQAPISRELLDARSLALMSVSGVIALALVSAVSLTQVRPSAIVASLVNESRDERRGGTWTRGSLLALQSAICVALLFSAGLFARSLGNVLSLDLGVDMDRTVQISFNIPRGARTEAEQRALFGQALDRLRSHPAVEHVALAGPFPFQSGSASRPFTGQSRHTDLIAYSTEVGAGFFTAVGARSLAGRDFTEADRTGAPRVAIVNAPLATRLFPAGGALESCVFLDEKRECVRVVGVLGGVWKLRALDRDQMAIYTPLAQTEGAMPGALLVRTRGAPGPLLGQLRTTVQSVAADLPAVSVTRAGDLVEWEFRPWRQGARLFAGFSAVALIIAAVGLYGVVSFTTTLRTREIGIRMALGARGAHIARVVSGAGLGAVIVGLIVGAAASLVASRWMGDVLYQTSPRDPVVLAQTAGVLLAVAAVAVIVPVVRAVRLPPAAVLRSD